MTANKATPELDKLVQATLIKLNGLIFRNRLIEDAAEPTIRAAIEQGIALAAADLIESEANTALAVENSKLRILLGDLVEAVDRTEDLDEADGPEFTVAMTELEEALSQARPYTEQGLIESLQNQPVDATGTSAATEKT